jgi:hypothetical protein
MPRERVFGEPLSSNGLFVTLYIRVYIALVDETASRVEAGSNTSTVGLRVVGGDEKGSVESGTRNRE